MAMLVQIPPQALPGFKAIGELEKLQIEQLCESLEKISIVGSQQELNDAVSSFIDSKKVKDIVYTIYSFVDLLRPSGTDLDVLAENLTNSYIESNGEAMDPGFRTSLVKNLRNIFSHSSILKTKFKSLDLLYSEEKIFTDANVITDIRLIFNDDLDDANRNALIVHHLHIEYRQNREYNRIALALDDADLKKLKSKIERAFTKRDVIKRDYTEKINFLNFNSNEEHTN